MEFNLKVRRIIEKDWEFLPEWWKGYEGWEDQIPRDMLPEKGLGGFIVDKDGYPIGACFLWTSNAKTCFINGFVFNPDYRDTDRKEALDTLIQFTTKFAGDMGYKYAWSWTSAPTLAEAFKDNDYNMTEKAWEMVKHIN